MTVFGSYGFISTYRYQIRSIVTAFLFLDFSSTGGKEDFDKQDFALSDRDKSTLVSGFSYFRSGWTLFSVRLILGFYVKAFQ